MFSSCSTTSERLAAKAIADSATAPSMEITMTTMATFEKLSPTFNDRFSNSSTSSVANP